MRARVWLSVVVGALAVFVPLGARASTLLSDPPKATLNGSACSILTGTWSISWRLSGGSTTQHIEATHGDGQQAYAGTLGPGSFATTTSVTLPSGATSATLSIRFWDVGSDESESRTTTSTASLAPCLVHDADPVAYFQHYCGHQLGVYMANGSGAATDADFSIASLAGSKSWGFSVAPGEHRWLYIERPTWDGDLPAYRVRENGVILAETGWYDAIHCVDGNGPICPCADQPPRAPSPGPGSGSGSGTGSGSGPGSGAGSGSGSGPGFPSQPSTSPAGAGSTAGASTTPMTSGAEAPGRDPIPTAAINPTSSAAPIGWIIGLGAATVLLVASLAAGIVHRRHRHALASRTAPPTEPGATT